MQGKVEICGVNTSKLKVLKSEETMELLRRTKQGDMAAREELIAGNLRLVLSVIQKFANRYLAAKDVFFIGRGLDYAISMEGSLKLKETSYIHSEACAAGELKHGTISLIEEGTLVAAVVTQDQLLPKMVSNIVEVRTRGAFVMAVTNVGNVEIEKNADYNRKSVV